MVDEVFLQKAVNIRRTYLKVYNNLDFYGKRANGVINELDNIMKRVSDLQDMASDDKNKNDKILAEKAMHDFAQIIEDLELQGTKLEEAIEPLNKEIEKLAMEEQELYRQIKLKHSELTDDQIIECVKKRLEEENLSN